MKISIVVFRLNSNFKWALHLSAMVLLILLSACQTEPTEHSESAKNRPAGMEQRTATISDVEGGIRKYISLKTIAGDGYFGIEDDSLQLNLRLVRVHTEYLSVLEPGRYFACVDLADTTGDVYDVDFFLAGTPDSMFVTETKVHKLNGKPFYTWKQQPDKTWHRVPVESASSGLLGVIEGTDHFEFQYSIQLPEIENPGRIWIPLAQSDAFQTVEIKSIVVPAKDTMLQDLQYSNRALFVELEPQHSGAKIEITYDVIRREKGPHISDAPVSKIFRASTPLMPTGGKFQEIAFEVIQAKQAKGALEEARALYDYVSDTVRYAKQGTYGTGDANFACDTRSGNCTEFHSLFISLARSADIPARFAIGAAIPSERNEGGVDGYHCWAEFFAEGKWWPVDISEGNKYAALSTYYFGHHPANRIELSHGRDLVFQPGPQSGPIPFFAYPILEIGVEEVPVKTLFTFTRYPKN